MSIGRGKMAALEPQDFAVRWVFPPDTPEGKKLNLEAIYGPPVWTKDTVYFGAYDGGVYAVSALDGSLRWAFETDGPIIGGVTLFDPDPKDHPELASLFAGSDDGKLYRLDPATGSPKETFDAGDSIWSTPLVEGGVVYVGSVNGKLYARDASNLSRSVWEEPFEADAGLISDPVLANGDTLLVGGIDRTLYALDPGTGRKKWDFEADNWFWGRPLIADGRVYVPNLDKHVYALDLESGEPAWERPFEAEGPVRSSPLLADGVLVIVDRTGNVYGLDPATGGQKWAGPALLDDTVLSDPILLDERVLIVAQGGDIFRVDPAVGTSSLVEVLRP